MAPLISENHLQPQLHLPRRKRRVRLQEILRWLLVIGRIRSSIHICRVLGKRGRLSRKPIAGNGDALVIVTEWEEFRSMKLAKIKSLMRMPVIIDGRNILDANAVRQEGFEYHGIGKC